MLVLDDDPLMLRFVRDALAAAGWTALPTGDPEQLGRLIQAERPHLVLLDVVLPDTDGIDLMRRIPELAELPVIFISGYGNDATIAKALELGATDYIVKPFSPTELVARIRAALRRRDRPAAFVLDQLRVRYDQRRVTVAGRKVDLTPHRVRVAARALAERGTRGVHWPAAADGVGPERRRRRRSGAHVRQEAAPQAGRRRGQPPPTSSPSGASATACPPIRPEGRKPRDGGRRHAEPLPTPGSLSLTGSPRLASRFLMDPVLRQHSL